MNRRQAASLMEICIQVAIILILGAILAPPIFIKAKHNARRTSCQSNLKRITLAALQYTQDSDDHLPSRQWGERLAPYLKDESVFQCPETYTTPKTTDYFGNARYLGHQLSKIKKPETLVLFGEGVEDAPRDTTLSQLPTEWLGDPYSPLWRHLKTANYAFADGHIKAYKSGFYLHNLRLQF